MQQSKNCLSHWNLQLEKFEWCYFGKLCLFFVLSMGSSVGLWMTSPMEIDL
jgi:hypothetical protein